MKLLQKLLGIVIIIYIIGCGTNNNVSNPPADNTKYDFYLNGTWDVVGFADTFHFHIGAWVTIYDSVTFKLNNISYNITKPDTSIFKNLFTYGDYLYTFVNIRDTVGIHFFQNDYHKINTSAVHLKFKYSDTIYSLTRK